MNNKFKMLILGRSGSGKSTSMRNLDPATTGIINCDKQELIFPTDGYATNLLPNGAPDLETSNYVETGKPSSVIATINAWSERSDIKVIVLDTITHLITDYYINDALGKEFGGYKELGTSFWKLLDAVRKSGKHVVVFGHMDNKFNDLGQREITMKSHGKMIDQFEPESYFNILFLAEVLKVDGNLKWMFKTQPDEPVEKVKCPSRFNAQGEVERSLDKHEDNDIAAIIVKLENFYRTNN